jgi:uncharacterized protein
LTRIGHLPGFALLVATLAAFAGSAHAAPSFDCAKVEKGSTEALICGDEELSALDREVDRLYRKLKESVPAEDFERIKTFQQGWLKGRNESWKAENPRQHVYDSYKAQIAILSIQAGELMAPKLVSYECTGGEFVGLDASFYTTTPPVGVFTRTPGGDWPQFIATGWDDQGAIHYNIGGLDFIERDGVADLNWGGTLMKCTRLK